MSAGDTNPTLDKVIADYLRAVESGDGPDREELISQHPELVDDLKSFFANHDQMKQTAGSEDATIPPRRITPAGHNEDAAVSPSGTPAEDATRPPTRNTDEDATLPPGAQIGVPEVGTKVRYFGDYELLDEIARGGMGVVYKARQVNLNRMVALKMILAGQLASEEAVQRFYAEAEAAANLDHPGIVPIFEVGEHEGQHYFSMGFVEGESLADKIKEGPLPPRQAAEYTKRVAEAMAYAHGRGVIHRDLKPANVLLDQDDDPVPQDLETICLKSLEKEQARRYASTQELADELDRFLRGEPIRARPLVATVRACRWCRRKPTLASLLAAVILLLATTAICLLVGGGISVYFAVQSRNNELRAVAKARELETTLNTSRLIMTAVIALDPRRNRQGSGGLANAYRSDEGRTRYGWPIVCLVSCSSGAGS